LIVLIPIAIGFYYFSSLAKKEEIIAGKGIYLKTLILTSVILAHLITYPLIRPEYHGYFFIPFMSLIMISIKQVYYIYFFLPLIPLFYLLTVAIEFVVYYIVLKRRKFDTKDLFETIAFINLLTSPLAVFLNVSFPNYLFYFIILILLESIFLVDKINKTLDEESLATLLSKVKLVSIVCVANMVSMLVGIIPLIVIYIF